jgi:hypothetical protein
MHIGPPFRISSPRHFLPLSQRSSNTTQFTHDPISSLLLSIWVFSKTSPRARIYPEAGVTGWGKGFPSTINRSMQGE